VEGGNKFLRFILPFLKHSYTPKFIKDGKGKHRGGTILRISEVFKLFNNYPNVPNMDS